MVYRVKHIKPPPHCKYCGKDGLVWVQTPDGKWRLRERDGLLHVCKPIKQREDKYDC
jgi:hypothetical protein